MDNEEDLGEVRRFFDTNQKELFDKALKTMDTMRSESAYVEGDVDVQSALADIRAIVEAEKPYGKIKDLGGLTEKAMKSYLKLCAAKRDDMLGRARLGIWRDRELRRVRRDAAAGACAAIVAGAGESRVQKRASIHEAETCSRLDAIGAQIDAWRNSQLTKIDVAVRDAQRPKPNPAAAPSSPSRRSSQRPSPRSCRAARCFPPRRFAARKRSTSTWRS